MGGQKSGGYDFAFLDSGTGGLPYIRRLRELLPSARCVYLADTLHFPYGEKKRDEVIRLTFEAVSLLLALFSPRVIVLACNTMSVAALEKLRSRYLQAPFVGTVPAIKLAAARSLNRKIGLLASSRTVADPYTDALIAEFAGDCEIIRRGDGELISFIENNLVSSDRESRIAAVSPAVNSFRSAGADTIVLACTHFIHVKDEIAELAGTEVSVIDSCDGVARQAASVFSRISSSGIPEGPGSGEFYVTGFPEGKTESYYEELASFSGLLWKGRAAPGT
ncbi:MAG: glutamate racemase [Spirochaetaceae bacterium]|jgi:glutamate racemase|nr:glutamate racemase [Spirochaetaceae bacterium]